MRPLDFIFFLTRRAKKTQFNDFKNLPELCEILAHFALKNNLQIPCLRNQLRNVLHRNDMFRKAASQYHKLMTPYIETRRGRKCCAHRPSGIAPLPRRKLGPVLPRLPGDATARARSRSLRTSSQSGSSSVGNQPTTSRAESSAIHQYAMIAASPAAGQDSGNRRLRIKAGDSQCQR